MRWNGWFGLMVLLKAFSRAAEWQVSAKLARVKGKYCRRPESQEHVWSGAVISDLRDSTQQDVIARRCSVRHSTRAFHTLSATPNLSSSALNVRNILQAPVQSSTSQLLAQTTACCWSLNSPWAAGESFHWHGVLQCIACILGFSKADSFRILINVLTRDVRESLSTVIWIH